MLTHNPHKHLKKILARLYDDNNPVRKKGSRNDESGIMESDPTKRYMQMKRAKEINDFRDTINPESGIGNVPDEYMNKDNQNNVLRLLEMFNPPDPMDSTDDVYAIPNATKPKFKLEDVPEPDESDTWSWENELRKQLKLKI